MKLKDKIQFKTSKNSLQIYYGWVVGFKADKIQVTKYKYSDYSGFGTTTWIDMEDIL